MNRNVRAAALLALCCSAAGIGLSGCDEAPAAEPGGGATTTTEAKEPAFTGAKKITVDGRSVTVSCSGQPEDGEPVVVLLAGAGDELKKFADIQETLGAENRVCSYDRLGAGASDQPGGPQTLDDAGTVLTAVIDQVAGGAPVVLAGHSLGGLIAARYAPDHQDTVKGLVLMDATSPTQSADLTASIPESATGMAVQLRDETLAAVQGQNPEQLAVPDGEVRSAGDLPVEVIQHGKPYLEAVPEYGPDLERAWAEGQRKWLTVSSRGNLSIAANSEHYIYVDEPELVVRAIQRVAVEATAAG
ncbi:alpha/beta fold hydrolase [Actinophytocola algeriensis]|uniref:Pimeloyl-ACP methyl ester carboxylesterase n=1 Tax=Actinophytocola algeriensis TaxID=1768010 RepID=A0A7W7Q7H3_9PSEU|nr:alpha/beta hydrolase [Actinophytocola algeriensis]MBB4908507.1 pimeloyl-ACP methyl ester carboxylesterase [Actinophytocola algeriensis]MBE1475106.1 pimeloyl-ACP methyl ester carboxylesterase [Actinophytocola algeriensis]